MHYNTSISFHKSLSCPEKTVYRPSSVTLQRDEMGHACVIPPFHQGFFPVGPIWTKLSRINQLLIRQIIVLNHLLSHPFLTRLSPDQWTMGEDVSRKFLALMTQRSDRDPLIVRNWVIFVPCSPERGSFLPLYGRFQHLFHRSSSKSM